MTLHVLLRVAVTAAFVGWLVHQFGLATMLTALGQAPRQCAEAAVLTVLMILTMALRWHVLLGVLDVVPRFREVVRATFAGYVAGSFLPSVGGDVVKVAFLVRERGVATAVAVSTVVDRSLGILALFALGLAATALHAPAPGVARYVRAAYVVVSVILLVMVGMVLLTRRLVATGAAAVPTSGRRLERLRDLARHVSTVVDTYAGRKIALGQALGLALASQIISILTYYWIARAVGVSNGILDFFYGVPLVALTALLPISIGGIGLGEWAFVQVFTELGMSRDATLAVSLLNLTARLAVALVGAAVPWLTSRP